MVLPKSSDGRDSNQCKTRHGGGVRDESGCVRFVRKSSVTSAVFNNETAAGVTGDRSLSDRGKLQFVDVTFDFCPFHSLVRLPRSCEINHY